MRVPEDGRSPAADVVDVAIAIDIGQRTALGAGDEARRATNGAEGADGAVHAADNQPLGALHQAL
jgi:hypothetical protein